MMEQRTLNVINICKGNTKYNSSRLVYDAIRRYMAEECMVSESYYSDDDISLVLWDAMKDYIDHCDKPSFFMENSLLFI